ncbi:hypothetical protein UFOVP371_36 [uncultured Caudovirales phage]|uniref:Uncharacterized protein n=1 Tax=uncultured Caudovirales phage TaxID=2100421 RepID=A0A6J7WXR0_9CAUD|nr:hypothetical protein UFOVP371_36 [uncultured Caudovirales phage]
MTVVVSGSNITFNDNSVQNTAATGFGFKNRIINGAMVIDQRNAGASVSTNGAYPLDRWTISKDGGTIAASRSTTSTAGFSNSLLFSVTTGYTPTAAQQNNVRQMIEGFNTADLAWGTASAQTVTLSFWVRSSLTGTFCGSLNNSAYDRSYVFTFSIAAANTWEYKTVTIAGDTSGTWLTDNGVGIRVIFDLGSGSNYNATAGAWSAGEKRNTAGAVQPITTSGATFYITGVQLEKGSTATSFDYRPYGTELQLAQRYYQQYGGSNAYPRILMPAYTTGAFVGGTYPYIVSMRATPTGARIGAWDNQNSNSGDNNLNVGLTGFLLYTLSNSTTVISGLYPSNSTGLITLSAEL